MTPLKQASKQILDIPFCGLYSVALQTCRDCKQKGEKNSKLSALMEIH